MTIDALNPTARPRRNRPVAGVVARLAILAAAIAIVTLAVHGNGPGHTARLALAHPAGAVLAAVATAYGAFALLVNLGRLALALAYRPTPAPTDDRLATLTVVVPAYNEGRLVRETLLSLLAADYPAARMQIIAVDDGSTDDTWEHIQRAAAESAGRIVPIRCPRNRGKRWALHEGFVRATGEVIVTVDSDSVVERDTLRNLVAPLVADSTVGAVAGNVRVLNRDAGVIPRLLSVSWVGAFDFVRAAESVLGSVLCTPGALAAYRAACVRPVLERWLHQRYFGQEANIGEDRALTNLVLEQGFAVRFQSTARVWTTAPTGLAGLRRMYTRWARSDVRESVAFARFGFRRFADWPAWRLALTRLNFLAKSLAMLLTWPMLAVMLALSVAHPATIGLSLLAGTVLGSAWGAAVCLWRGRRIDAVLAAPYALLWLVALWWITPWGLATSHRGGWLTRADAATPRRFRLRALAARVAGIAQRTPGLARLTSFLF